MIHTFTSTGKKFIHHPSVVARLKNWGKPKPVSLQIAPTSKCNLNCCFCSNVNRQKHESLDIESVRAILRQMYKLNARTVEWTGGGDPTMWEFINEAIICASQLHYQQGFITNGVALAKNIDPYALGLLHWVRVSMNCLDYVEEIEIPEIRGTLGFSYVWNTRTDEDVLRRLREYVDRYRPAYVRIVPNCQATDEEQERNNRVLGEKVASWGKPYFYQPKTFCKPNNCYWGYFKPFILHDGWVYPCSSVVLNVDAERKFHEKYRWVKMQDLHRMYDEKIESFPTNNCNHCVFAEQNQIIENILCPDGMELFL